MLLTCLHRNGDWKLNGCPKGSSGLLLGPLGASGYQDDQYLYGRAVDLARALPRLDESLAQDGHRVRRDKCSLWNPAMDLPEIANQTSADDTRQALAELAREMTVCKGGIDMLGSVARGELSARVQASGIGPQAMQKRATKAHMLVDRVIAFSRESGCPKRVHMAWTLLARAAAAALTYEARLVPRETLEITSKELERHSHGAVCGLLGDELDEHAMRRMVLPGVLGGCGLRMDAVGLAADAAFWSTWAMTVKVVPGVAKDAGLGKVSNADELAAAAAQRRLAEAGVEVDADGRPSAR